jgi:hypothetical protein
VDFQNPVARPAVRVWLAQRDGVPVPYPQAIGILRLCLVREMADQMSGGLCTPLPTVIRRETFDVVIQLSGRKIRRLLIEILAACEGAAKIGDQTVLVRIGSHHIGASKIRLPLLEHRTEIQIHNVVGGDAPIRAVIVVGQQCIGSSAGDPFVPMAAHTETRLRQRMDLFCQLAFKFAGAHQAAIHDLRKQRFGF